MDVDANDVIAALREQLDEAHFALALARAQVKAATRAAESDAPDA